MLVPGGWVNVALPKGLRRAQLVEVQGERCCCVFEDGKKAWVATSTVTALDGAPSDPAPSRATQPARSLRQVLALALTGAAVLAIAASTFVVLKRRASALLPAPDQLTLPVPTPPQLRSIVSGMSLAFTNGGWDLEPQPNVVIDRRAIYVENEKVADIEPLRVANRLQRIDDLFSRLKAVRSAWTTTNAGKEYPGTIQFWVDEETSALVVKDVLMTSAFAGHPNQGFVLRRRAAPLRLERLNAFVESPGPRRKDALPPSGRALGVALRADDQVELAWLGVGLEPPLERVVPLATLGAGVEQLWKGRPAGLEVDLQHGERAVVSVPDSVPFRKLAQVLDGISAAKVKLDAQEAPAFVTRIDPKIAENARKLAEEELGPTPIPHLRVGAAVLSGPLDQRAVHETMRASFGKLRECYEHSLAKSPQLSGRLQLRFVIERNGRVNDAEMGPDSTLHDTALERCILAEVRLLVFPPPYGGTVNVSYPIVLQPRRFDDGPNPASAVLH